MYDVATIIHGYKPSHEKCPTKPFVSTKRIEHRLAEAVKNIITDPVKAQQYIDSGFDDNEIVELKSDIKQLEKLKLSIQEKTDMLLDLYLDKRWKKDQLNDKRTTLDNQMTQIKIELNERKRKSALIQNSQLNYDTVSQYLSVAKRYE